MGLFGFLKGKKAKPGQMDVPPPPPSSESPVPSQVNVSSQASPTQLATPPTGAPPPASPTPSPTPSFGSAQELPPVDTADLDMPPPPDFHLDAFAPPSISESTIPTHPQAAEVPQPKQAPPAAAPMPTPEQKQPLLESETQNKPMLEHPDYPGNMYPNFPSAEEMAKKIHAQPQVAMPSQQAQPAQSFQGEEQPSFTPEEAPVEHPFEQPQPGAPVEQPSFEEPQPALEEQQPSTHSEVEVTPSLLGGEPRFSEPAPEESEQEDTPQPVFSSESQASVLNKLPPTHVFVSVNDYQRILNGTNSIKNKLRESEGILGRLQVIMQDEEKTFENWRAQLEDIERKLSYADQIIAEADSRA